MAKKTYAWKDPGALTTAYVVALGFLAFLRLGAGVISLVFGEATALPYQTDAEWSPLQSLVGFCDFVQAIALLIAAGIAVFWALRASRNAHTFGWRMENSPAAAVYWYFVPFMSLFKPFGVMEEMFAASGDKRTGFLRAWWGLFLSGNILGALFARVDDPVMEGVSSLLGAGSAGVFIFIVRQLSALQRQKHSIADIFGDEPAESVLVSLA